MNENFHIAYWAFYNQEPNQRKRERLIAEIVQTICYNLVINYGPQSERDIFKYFNVQRAGKKGIRKQLITLITKKSDTDPLLVYKDKKYFLNDTITET